jgi:hypothetical protein
VTAGNPNPFEPPKSKFHPSDPSTDPSVFEEPWLSKEQVVRMNDRPLDPEAIPKTADPENSVWDEPGLASELSGEIPQDAVTWFRWYQAKAARVSALQSWQLTLAVGLVTGCLATLTLVMMQPSVQTRVVATILMLPILQELMKVVIAIWIC